jgi:hypothetical protein
MMEAAVGERPARPGLLIAKDTQKPGKVIRAANMKIE